MKIKNKAFYVFCLLVCNINSSYALEVAVLITKKQRSPYQSLIKDFQKDTGVRTRLKVLLDHDYKKNIDKWLKEGKNTPDVLYWQASQRLYQYAKSSSIMPITEFWNENNLDEGFYHVKDAVTYKGDIYAVPITYYNWGIYYNKDVLFKYSSPPTTIEGFLEVCKKIKYDLNINPISIGTKNHWTAAAWFDYINLRTNGIEFHRQLLNGEVSFKDYKVVKIFEIWKEFIDADLFNNDANKKSWSKAIPPLIHGKSVFTLIGNFVTSTINKGAYSKIGFMPFPVIKDIPLYEEAPMDVFMVAKNTKNKHEALKFLKYISQEDIQSKHSERVEYLPPNKNAEINSSDKFVLAGFDLLNSAKSVTQYFDRDTLPAFEKEAVKVLSRFLTDGNIKNATDDLEKIRKAVFS